MSENEFNGLREDQMNDAQQSNQRKEHTSAKPPKPPTASCDFNLGKRKKTSTWWNHYDEVPDQNYARCKYCRALIGCKPTNGTTPLKNHIQRCKNLPTNMDKKQKMLEIGTKTIARDDGVLETIYLPSLWQFDQESSRKALARMIVVDELPFSFVEREGFRNFCKILNPAFVIPSRPTMTRDCYDFFVEEKSRLKDCFKNLSSRASLTTDAWTSGQNLSYMCLTAHFIDDNWVLHKRIINFCPLAGHSGQLIGRGVEKCLVDWEIKNILTVTVDNASPNDLAIDHLRRRFNHWESSILDGKYLHMRCVAHILNLVVKDGLKDMNKSILKVRALLRYVRSSPARLQRFKTCVHEEKIESKSLICLDVETRWNSTYLVLESAVKFRKAFDNLLMRDTCCNRELKKVGVPKEEDWKTLNYFLPILKVFYDATLVLSGSRYVTCNTCVQHAFAIGFAISALCNDEDDEGCRKMAQQMKLKYDKYWGDVQNMNYMLFVSIFLDPRHKMQLVDWLVRQCYVAADAAFLNLNVKMLIDELFKLYASSMLQVSKKPSSASSSSSSMSFNESCQGKVMDFTKLLTSRFQMDVGFDDSSANKTELDKYVEETRESDCENFNILQWWKDNQKRYPILAKMACDVLAIPITTVASESAFSTGGRVLDTFRTSLTPRMVEALICTQDWQRATNVPIVIENLLAFEQMEEGMNLIAEQLNYIIDENIDY